MNKTKITYRLDPAIAYQFKMVLVENKDTQQAVNEQAVQNYLKRKKKSKKGN